MDGFVAKRSVQLGQRVPAGTPLMSVIALNQVWVEANFKERQLQNLRLGQPVELIADVYGKKVPYLGVIEGMGAGTGAAFALLPAQNITGNWIKVVQRVPVHITLDPKQLVEHPLRVGLSMDANVDVSKTDGRMLADVSRLSTVVQTTVFAPNNTAADAEVGKIIVANGGRVATLGAPVAARDGASVATTTAATVKPNPVAVDCLRTVLWQRRLAAALVAAVHGLHRDVGQTGDRTSGHSRHHYFAVGRQKISATSTRASWPRWRSSGSVSCCGCVRTSTRRPTSPPS